ncbi:type VII secretion-associated protein [Mycobacterium asiaticum]|uniref:Type VII secretion-associated protein n=1 Tax=Mycobacterium asiaticum TaxID=1790 RepID=A0A1A3CZ37_MYCAS|nr:type VII secretion-associated protein [Mycobacterium asiaticum]OBI91366.1 type VII secretion-associated protein [Mycobacterium asiaticum]
MTAHRAVIAAGPAAVHRLCCGTADSSDVGLIALEAIDDPVALLDEQPVSAGTLWTTALRALADGHHGGPIVVHPSWWPTSRVDVITAAASTLTGATLQPRSWLTRGGSTDSTVVVEIADRLVAIAGRELTAVSRRMHKRLAGEVAAAVETTAPRAAVLIDAPGAVPGAPLLAGQIAAALTARGHTVTKIDDAALGRRAAAAAASGEQLGLPAPVRPRSRVRVAASTVAAVVAMGVVATLVTVSVPATDAAGPPRSPEPPPAPTTVLVEGQVALTVPAAWLTQRVTDGPGSARVQVTSPADPEVALHITQSPTPGETLTGAADRLRRAFDAEPAGVFVDFDPSGLSAGRPAVTYREVRPGHDVRWSVLLDGSVRISVGCQSRPQSPDAVRDACEQAVRSAHAVH